MVYFKKYILIFFITLYAFTLNADEEIISYTNIVVVDGDTIKFNNKKIRLHGIDTPEIKQICKNKKGDDFKCGIKVKLILIDLISSWRKVKYLEIMYKICIAILFALAINLFILHILYEAPDLDKGLVFSYENLSPVNKNIEVADIN